MPRKTTWPPVLKNDRGRARLRWRANGVDYDYVCGAWDAKRDAPTLAAERERLRVIEEYEATGRRPRPAAGSPAPGKLVGELALDYLAHCAAAYDGRQCHRVRQAVGFVTRRFAELPVADFDGPKFARAQADMVAHRYCGRCRRDEAGCRARAAEQAARRAAEPRDRFGRPRKVQCEAGFLPRPLTRRHVNHLCGCVRLMFRWGKVQGSVPPGVVSVLDDAPDLRGGARAVAPDRAPVGPADGAAVDATLPFLPPVVADMVTVQRWTGARPGEVCGLRPCDVERPGVVVGGKEIWVWRLAGHKNAWRGRRAFRVVPPPAQRALARYLEGRAPEAYCFSPRESWEASLAARRKPGKGGKRKPGRKRARPPGECYSTQSYGHAVRTACLKAGVEPWHPHRLRHSAGEMAFTLDGVDGSMAYLGHDSPQANAVYRQALERAARLAARFE